jgi:cell division septal protein FtsQ
VPRGRQAAPARAQTRVDTPALDLLPSVRSLAVGFGLLAAVLGLYIGARESSIFSVHSIEVTTEPPGHTRLVERRLAPLAGTSLLEIDQAAIARRLEALPHVHLVGYDRSFPNGLQVEVRVERPVAVLRRANENWLVSAEGRVLRKLEGRLRRPLPVVWIPRGAEPETGAILRSHEPARAVAALASMRASAPRFAQRVWYVAKGEEGGLRFVLRDRFEVRLGNATDLALKLEVARTVLAAIRSTGSTASYVDVSVPERPVAGTTLDSQVEP